MVNLVGAGNIGQLGIRLELVAPEFIWELGIGIYLIVKGYRTSSPVLRDQGAQSAPA